MKRRAILITLLLILCIGLLSYLYYNYLYNQKHAHELILYGNVDIRQVDLGFRVNGRIEEMFFDEGDEVKAGQLMGYIQQQPYKDQVYEAKARLDSTSVSLQNAEKVYQRRLDLSSSGSVSQEDLENATTNKDTLTANLQEAKAALGVAITNFRDTKVYAPTDGYILTRIREPGSMVNPGDPIYTLSIKNPVWIRAYVNEPNLGRIYFGMPADVYTDTKDGKIYRGHIGFISPVSEFTPKTVETKQLRTDLVYRLRVYVDNPDLSLKQGMPVTVILRPQLLPSTEANSNLSDKR
jgi:HlyD family secretion protein